MCSILWDPPRWPPDEDDPSACLFVDFNAAPCNSHYITTTTTTMWRLNGAQTLHSTIKCDEYPLQDLFRIEEVGDETISGVDQWIASVVGRCRCRGKDARPAHYHHHHHHYHKWMEYDKCSSSSLCVPGLSVSNCSAGRAPSLWQCNFFLGLHRYSSVWFRRRWQQRHTAVKRDVTVLNLDWSNTLASLGVTTASDGEGDGDGADVSDGEMCAASGTVFGFPTTAALTPVADAPPSAMSTVNISIHAITHGLLQSASPMITVTHPPWFFGRPFGVCVWVSRRLELGAFGFQVHLPPLFFPICSKVSTIATIIIQCDPQSWHTHSNPTYKVIITILYCNANAPLDHGDDLPQVLGKWRLPFDHARKFNILVIH